MCVHFDVTTDFRFTVNVVKGALFKFVFTCRSMFKAVHISFLSNLSQIRECSVDVYTIIK